MRKTAAARSPARSTDELRARQGPAVVCEDVHITYRIYADKARPSMRELVARRFRPRPARQVHAVRGVSFTLEQGEALGLIGPNGSGKSSLLRVIAGLLAPTQGEVYARATPILLGVAAALNKQLSGRRNVFLGGTALGLPRDEIEVRFDDIVAFAGLEDFIDLPLRAYSSGMRARLQFAIATALIPDVLLIDEALSVGDEEFKEKSERRMTELLDGAGAIIMVTHALPNIIEMCSRAIWLEEGTIRADGDPGDVVKQYRQATGDRRRTSGDGAAG